jgi:hypothetical protein
VKLASSVNGGSPEVLGSAIAWSATTYVNSTSDEHRSGLSSNIVHGMCFFALRPEEESMSRCQEFAATDHFAEVDERSVPGGTVPGRGSNPPISFVTVINC